MPCFVLHTNIAHDPYKTLISSILKIRKQSIVNDLQLQIGAAIRLSSQAVLRDLFANSCFGLTHHLKKSATFLLNSAKTVLLNGQSKPCCMRVLLVFLLFCVYALFARWYYVCEIRHLCGDTPAAQEDTRLKTLRLLEADTAILEGYDQFALDSTRISPRLNANNADFLDTLAAHLKQFPKKNLTITGAWHEGERGKEAGFYENRGVARADAVRKLLIRRGIAENRISLDHVKNEDSLLREPLAFEVYAPTATPTEFEKVQFSFTNMTFSDANFEFGSDVFRPGDAFVLYADSVKTYLDMTPNSKLTIVGHTDNVGSDKFNDNLGLRRAESARQYFRNLGVKADIRVKSEGKRRPVATNETDEGRQKNRRVNFLIE